MGIRELAERETQINERIELMNKLKEKLSSDGYIPIGDLERSCLYAADYSKKAHLALTKEDEFFDVAINKQDSTCYSIGFYFRLKNAEENHRGVHRAAMFDFKKLGDAHYSGMSESDGNKNKIGEIIGYSILLDEPKGVEQMAQSISQTVQQFYKNVSAFGIESRNPQKKQ